MIVRGVPDVSVSVQPLLERIAQAAAWCGPRADVAHPRDCLRTPSLAPRPLERDRFSAVSTVLDSRQRRIGQAFGWQTAGPGRLMVHFPDADLSDGAAEAETNGWFDAFNIPPWDTWAGFFQDAEPGDRFLASYLLAWVPPAMEAAVARGIHVNPEGCIAWLEDTDCGVRGLLAGATGPLARFFGS